MSKSKFIHTFQGIKNAAFFWDTQYSVCSRDFKKVLKTRLPPCWRSKVPRWRPACQRNHKEIRVQKMAKIDSKLMISEYAISLEPVVKERYKEKISVIRIDPFLIPLQKLQPECLPPVEACDLLSYLVLDTSYYTNSQFKTFQSLQAYNQMVSGFISSVLGHKINNKYVVLAKVRHFQRMNYPLVQIWIITNTTERSFRGILLVAWLV